MDRHRVTAQAVRWQSAQRDEDVSAPVAPGTARLRLLEAQGDDLPEPDVMRLALQQATAALGALGGFVHVRRKVAGSDELRLVTASGLPDTITHAWVSLPQGDDQPPVRALHDGETHWAAGDRAGIGATGMIAVPLRGGDGPLGALSLFTAEGGEPDPAQCSFLDAVGSWAAQRVGRFSGISRPQDPAADERASRLVTGVGDPAQAPPLSTCHLHG